VIGGVSVIALLAVAVALLPSLRLAQAMQSFSLAQGAAAVGVAGAASSPLFAEQLLELFTYLNIINFGQREEARARGHAQLHEGDIRRSSALSV